MLFTETILLIILINRVELRHEKTTLFQEWLFFNSLIS